MNQKHIISIIATILLGFNGFSQGLGGSPGEVANLNITSFFNEEAPFEKYQLNLNGGIPINKKSFILLGLSSSMYDFDFSQNRVSGLGDSNGYVFRARLGYRRILNNNWSLIGSISPTISSNLESSLTSEDFLFNSIAAASKKWGNGENEKNLTVGLLYGNALGAPRLIPVINYQNRINKHWEYAIGIPVAKLQYYFSERSSISFTAGLEGFYINNSRDKEFNNVDLKNSKLAGNLILTGLDYRKQFADNWIININAGFNPIYNLEIQDGDQNTLFDLDTSTSFYIGTRIAYKIDFNKNKK